MPLFERSTSPRTLAYIDSLPAGLESFPECTVRRDVHTHLREDFPLLSELRGLPEPVAAVLQARSDQEWFPEVVGNALYLLARDHCFTSDEAFYAWNHDNVMRLFNKPLYKALMFVLSTSLIIMGATKRWATFHLGSVMDPRPVRVSGERKLCEATLSYPPQLFDMFMLRQHCNSYLTALEASRATDARVTVNLVEPGVAAFEASWLA